MNVHANIEKFALDPVSPQEAAVYADAYKRLPLIAGTTLLAGAGLRGLTGLMNQVSRRTSGPPPTYPGALVAEIPHRRRDDEKTANPITSPHEIGWYDGAAATLGMTGLYGGWKGMDALLDRRRMAEKDEELEKAKRDFNAAIAGNPAKLAAEKTAAERLSDALDELFDKQADWNNPLVSMYGGYAALTGLPAALLGYQKAKSTSRQAVLQSAIQRRSRRSYQQRPTEILAGPADGDPAVQATEDEDVAAAANPGSLQRRLGF